MTTIHSLHQRPSHPGLPAQGPAPRPRRRAVDDSYLDRRRQGLKLVIPETTGKLDGFAIRIPPQRLHRRSDYIAEKPTTAEALNAAFTKPRGRNSSWVIPGAV